MNEREKLEEKIKYWTQWGIEKNIERFHRMQVYGKETALLFADDNTTKINKTSTYSSYRYAELVIQNQENLDRLKNE